MAQIPPDAQRQPEIRPWTVLVYIVADDPGGGELLDKQANQEIDRLVYATLDARLKGERHHVAVQVDFRSQIGVWRRIVGEGAWVKPESNAADPATLYGFFEWAKAHCPAENYLLLFWGHSQGPFGLFSDPDPWVWVAQSLTLTELRDALGAAKHEFGKSVDLVVFKDCFMSTIELAYELRDLADYVIASQGLVPIEVWPYEQLLAPLTRGRKAEAVAPELLDALERHYEGRAKDLRAALGEGVGVSEAPFALLDTSRAGEVSLALEDLVGAVAASRATDGNEQMMQRALTRAMSEAGDTALLEVRELCHSLREYYPDEAVRLAAQRLDEAVYGARALMVKQFATRPWAAAEQVALRRQAFGGVSLFCCPFGPTDRARSRVLSRASHQVYRQLELCRRSGWDAIALEAMPHRPAPATAVPAGLPDVVRAILPLMVLERLQSGGYFEQLEREAADIARLTAASFIDTNGLAPSVKGGGFAPSVKGGGFAPSVKGGGFAPSVKGGNFGPDANGETNGEFAPGLKGGELAPLA